MKKGIGVWIDHRNAVIVVPTKRHAETIEINSDIEEHTHISTGKLSHKDCGAQDIRAEDNYQRHVKDRLSRYYDQILQKMGNPESVLLFGPGEAKVELKKRMKMEKPTWDIAAVEAAPKMSNHEIVDKVLLYFSQKTKAMG